MTDDPVPITPLGAWIAAKIGRPDGPLTVEALHSYQLAKLNETLRLVQERSPFYRRVLGTRPLALSSLDQLAALPFTTAQHLRTAPLEFLCVRQDEVERIVTLPTSGTTGPPKRIFFTAADQELTRDFFHRGMSTMVEAGDRVLILLPGELPGGVGDLLREGLARMGVDGVPHGPVTDPARTLAVMESERVTALVGIPVQVFGLARLSTAAGATKGPLSLRSVLLSTDRVPSVVSSLIEATWGCPVYNHYGTTEMGLGGGVDCRALSGYHLREADLFFEIVDPVSGRPVPEGESGEVVFTTLTRAAMPLIRYRTGDASRFIPGPCPCGTVLRRMAHVDERLAGTVTLRSGAVVRQGDLDELLFAVDGLADFRVVFTRGAAADTIMVEVKRSAGNGDHLSLEELLQALRTMPALSEGIGRGALSLEVRDWSTGCGNINSGTSKRQIVQSWGASNGCGNGTSSPASA